MASGSSIVQKALESLRSSVNAQDQAAFESTKLADVYNEAKRIEREQGNRSSLTNMRRIEPVLAILESYAGVMDTFCQGFTPMVWVWVCCRNSVLSTLIRVKGPIKLMLTVCPTSLYTRILPKQND